MNKNKNSQRLVVYDAQTNLITVFRGKRMAAQELAFDAKRSFWDRVSYKNADGNLVFNYDTNIQSALVPEPIGKYNINNHVEVTVVAAQKHDANDKILLIDRQGDTVAFVFVTSEWVTVN